MPFVADTTYAPELLVFRDLREWPSLAEQVAVYGRLTSEGLLNVNTFALLDFRKAGVTASANAPEHAITAGGPKRRAYVVSTIEQAHFIEMMQKRAPRGYQLKAFLNEPDAMAWLFPKVQRFPVSFLADGARENG